MNQGISRTIVGNTLLHRKLLILWWRIIGLIFVTAPVSWAGQDEAWRALLRGDTATAFEEFHQLAKQDDVEAQNVLANMYADGKGVTQDYNQAVRWFSRAEVISGVPSLGLGELYLYGHGVPQDYSAAMKRLQFHADKGLGPAQVLLGFMYAHGLGVQPNNIIAHMWFNLAAASGDQYPGELRDKVAKNMTPPELREAQRLARERAGHLK